MKKELRELYLVDKEGNVKGFKGYSPAMLDKTITNEQVYTLNKTGKTEVASGNITTNIFEAMDIRADITGEAVNTDLNKSMYMVRDTVSGYMLETLTHGNKTKGSKIFADIYIAQVYQKMMNNFIKGRPAK